MRAERPDAVPIAGGTDLMVDINFDRRRPGALLDLGRVPELREWATEDGWIRLGAGVPYARIIDDARHASCPAWRWRPGRSVPRRSASAARSAATSGSASPAGDAHPPLLAAGAVVEVASAARGARRIPAAEFYTGVKRNALAADELIAAVLVPPASGPQQFCKVGTRNAMVIAVSAFACALHPDRQAVGTGIGSAAPTPRRAPDAETFLAGELEAAGLWESGAELPESLARRLRGAGRRGGVPHRRRPGERGLPAALPLGDGAPRRHVGLERLPEGGLTMRITTTVNGTEQEVDDVWPGESLLYVLRERMGLPGSKNACEQGECGSCTVYLDGEPVCSCLVAAGQAIGREVTTVEGLADGEQLHPVQEAFVECGAVQCGFCTPGLVVAAHDLLARVPDAVRPGDPGGAGREPLPVHRLREDPRRRPAGRPAAGADMSTRRGTTHRRPDDRSRPGRGQSAAARRDAQGHRRVRLRQRPLARRDGAGA